MGLYDEVILAESGLRDASESAVVIGVASHKIWLRSSHSGRLIGYTRDSLLQLLNSGLLRVVLKHSSTVEVNPSTPLVDSLADVESLGALKETIYDDWPEDLDQIIVGLLNSFSGDSGVHPLVLSYAQLTEFASKVSIHLEGRPLPAILLRIILILLFNDTAAPLIPFVSCLPVKEGSGQADHASLEVFRHYLLQEVKRDVVQGLSRVCVTKFVYSTAFKTSFPVMNLFPKLPFVSGYSCNPKSSCMEIEDPRRVFYIHSDSFIIDSILFDASTRGVKDTLFENRGYVASYINLL